MVEPESNSEAAKDQNRIDAMTDEYNALMKNNTWELTYPPNNKNIIRCR